MGAARSSCTHCRGGRASESDRADAEAANQVDDSPIIGPAKEPINEADIAIVEKTWAQVEALGVEAVGVILFRYIFTIAPSALQLFSFRTDPDVMTYQTPGLKAHGVKVVATVGTAVKGLREFEVLLPTLEALATRHAGYGVKPFHFDVVGEALMKTLQDGLGTGFTPRARLAWSKVWHALASPMIRTILALETEVTNAAFTESEICLVEESWSIVAALGAEEVGVLLFRQIFEVAPEAKALFPFADEPDLYNSPRLKAHAAKVVNTVGTAVHGLRKLDELVPVLQTLGTKHVGYGVLPPHYDIVGVALINTLKAGLGKAFDAETEAAWKKVYGVVQATMVGTNYS